MEFEGKVVLVTGSSSGIGEATALDFAKLGARVVITGRNREKLKLVEQKCQAASTNATGVKSVLAVEADVTKDEELKRLIDVTINEFGQLDVLVNNAGAAKMVFSIQDPAAVDAFDFTMSTNLRSAFVLTHLAVPHLVKTKGSIVNVSSVAAMKPIPPLSTYSMSKAALDMFTKCLALELGPQCVRVNSVNPGGVLTNFGNAMGFPEPTPELIKEEESYVPIRKIAASEDISPLIVFLASSKAANMTGSCVVTDGGVLWAPRPAPKLEDSIRS